MADKPARKRSAKVRHLDTFSEGMEMELRRAPNVSGKVVKDISPLPSPSESVDWKNLAAVYKEPERHPPALTADKEQSEGVEIDTSDVMEDNAGQKMDELQQDESDSVDSLGALPSEDAGSIENKLSVIVQYWKQGQNESTNHRPVSLSRTQARKLWRDVEKNKEVESKERTVKKELHFIKKNFWQRRCKKFCPCHNTSRERFARVLKRYNIDIPPEKFYCQCGLEKEYHSSESLSHASTSHLNNTWSVRTHSELTLPWNFGNLDMPGNYSYLDLPQGTRKFLRLDDLNSRAQHLWELLTDYWQLRMPNLVISITGGDVNAMFSNPTLHKNFRDGIIKTAVNTKAWVITEGLYMGSSKEIGDIFQEDLKRSEWSEVGDHADIPLIAIGPWGVLAGQNYLAGIYVGSQEAKYNFIGLDSTSGRLNALDPYHTVYLLCDDGTHGRYIREPLVRGRLESYIKTQTTIEMLGSKGVSTPVVILVLGGDTFTLQRLAEAVDERVSISVVIVNGSGLIANMLAEIFKSLETMAPSKDKQKDREWTSQEEKTLVTFIKTYEEKGLLKSKKDKEHLKQFMTARHLITVFGTDDGDSFSLDKAILEATFGGIDDITAQLNLALAMDRAGLAKDTIFVESRKEELKSPGLVENALFVALEAGKSEFTQLLLDQDVGGEVNFEEFLTVKRLHDLHRESLNPSKLMGKLLRSLTKKDAYGGDALKDDNLLPQVGRIIYKLMGDNYRLLYQENYFRNGMGSAGFNQFVVSEKSLPYTMCKSRREEAVWHIFLWAVLCNHKNIAEYFLFETDCKMGAALVAYKMLTEMSKVAEVWHETELVSVLKENARYFQDLALETLDNLYEMNREDAYAALVSVISFHWGQYVTPLAIADDAEAKRFMGHACCQTFLNLLWMHYMDLDTSWWKLLPVFGLMPFLNIPFITFDKKNLAFGSYKDSVEEVDTGGQVVEDLADTPTVEDLHSKGYDETSIVSETIEKVSSRKKSFLKRLNFAWFCVRNYYTAPVNKFTHSLVTFMIFLGFFTHFVLSELRPIGSDGASEISVYEWLIYIWVASIVCQEVAQLISRKSSGPLYRLSWTSLEPSWSEAWHWHERMAFVLRIHKFYMWISDRWNSIDALMILMFLVSVVLRFTLNAVDIGVVRICFCITLILFYVRLLRFGYLLRHLGPRIVTIKAMMGDLFYFIIILAVFIVSFGVAFQALLDPNQPPSWGLLSDVLWRSYWQMFGELLIDDATEGMGLPVAPRNCTSDRELAKTQPDVYEYCYNWMVPVLLGVYMIITNILLLNLLIAIFSNSFEKIESESLIIWRYHLYDLVHEYYIQVWLPPPLNILCHVTNVLLWCVKWPRRWLFLAAMRRKRRIVHAELEEQKVLGKGAEEDSKMIARETEYAVRKECCSFFYFDNKDKEMEYVDHFRQEEYMRNEDLEEMAYKRFLRRKKKMKDKDGKIKDMLKQQSVRLQNITMDLIQLKQNSALPTLHTHSTPRRDVSLVNRTSILENPITKVLQNDIADLNDKMDYLHKRLDQMAADMSPILDYVKAKSSKSKRRHSGISETP